MSAKEALHHIFADARDRFHVFLDLGVAKLRPDLKKVGEMLAETAEEALVKHLEQIAIAKGEDPAVAEAVAATAAKEVAKALKAGKGSKVVQPPASTPVVAPAASDQKPA